MKLDRLEKANELKSLILLMERNVIKNRCYTTITTHFGYNLPREMVDEIAEYMHAKSNKYLDTLKKRFEKL